MTTAQMNKSLRAFSKTFAFKALQQLVERKKVDIALELLSMDLATDAAKKTQGRPLGMVQLLSEIENIPEVVDEEE